MAVNPHGGDPKTVADRLGLKKIPTITYDFSVNVNPFGPPEKLRALLFHRYDSLMHYPEPYADTAVNILAHIHNTSENNIIVGNGSTEIFSWIAHSLKPMNVGWIDPCYGGYEESCRSSGIPAHGVCRASPETNFSITREMVAEIDRAMIFIASPNNPTGMLVEPELLITFAKDYPKRIFVIDESFIDFLPDASSRTLIGRDIPSNLIVVKSLTKFFAIPGLRLGMAYSQTDTITTIKTARLPWSVNAFSQIAAAMVYDDKAYIKKTRNEVISLRKTFITLLSEFENFTIFPSSTNFLLVKLPPQIPVFQLQKAMLESGVLIRSCHNFNGLGESYCRLAIRPLKEIEYFISVLHNIMEKKGIKTNNTTTKSHRRTPAIMVVGTMSNSGKSVIAAGLCRYFARRKVHVAPFKAQNMALNSYVTSEGGEMGRAQVCQAKAAGIIAHTDMNPILLKPTGESFSQIIANGQPIGNYSAKEFYREKKNMKQIAHDAYDRLSKNYDLIILEGAGSPAEINLMEEDFVNMNMAAYANADTVLVADIDRGGVFASIFGTITLIPSRYRKYLKGIIINKFRGDASLLDSGIRQIHDLTGIPILGVLPFLHNLTIEDEDSLGLENRKTSENHAIDIVVIRLPRISNHTDFLSLEKTHGVRVRYVNQTADMGYPDLIIIPGTKNVRADMAFLHEHHFVERIKSAVTKNIPVFGICGGYQMLGKTIADPYSIEGPAGQDEGLSLLDLETVLEKRKELAQVDGIINTALPFAQSGTSFSGYEIHVGQTTVNQGIRIPLTITKRRSEKTNEPSGAVGSNGLVFGCYIHGFFDTFSLRKQIVDWLCERKGIPPLKIVPEADQERDEFDFLTDSIEKHFDLSLWQELCH